MNVIVAAATAAGVLLGAYMGYGPSGIGGAIFYGALIGLGGAIFSSLLVRTTLLMRYTWKLAVATIALAIAIMISWGVHL